MASEEAIAVEAARFIASLRRLRLFAHQAQVGAELDIALQTFDSLMFSTTHFNDEKSGAPYMEINVTGMNGIQRRTANRSSLLEGLLAINGREPEKKCQGCHQTKPLAAFSIDNASADGRNCICLLCVRQKVKSYTQAKKQAAIAKAAEAVKRPSPQASPGQDQG